MGFMFRKPEINTVSGSYRTDGLVDNVQMLNTASQIYMGNDLVYPYTPFSSSNMVAWWRGDVNVTTSGSSFVSWDTYYSSTGNTYTITGSSPNVEYTDGYPPGGVPTGGKHKAIYDFSNYVYGDMNNIFTSSSDITIVMAGRIGRGFSFSTIQNSWFGMTGDWNAFIGESVTGGGNTNYTLKRDEDSGPSNWFGMGAPGSNVTALSYNGTTGLYSYWQDFGTSQTPISGTRSGAAGRLGATQQLRLGIWYQVNGYVGEIVNYDIIVLNYIPTSTELQLWGSYVANNYTRIYL